MSPEESVSNGRKIAKSVTKALPAVGTVATAADATTRINEAKQQDMQFQQAMRELGIPSTEFDNHSFNREIAILGSEEVGGNVGAAGAATVAVPVSSICGIAAPICFGGITFLGGFVGDQVGNSGGAAGFDEIAEKNAPEEMKRIRQLIRKQREESDQKVILEDPERPGGF